MTAVQTGLDVLIQQDFAPLRGRRVGLMTNPSAVTLDLTTAYDAFRRAEGFTLAALFGPEHGVLGAAADGEKIAAAVDARTGVPVHSLYGDSLRPTPAMLEGLDVLVCDIQDIGVRYYTFTWTISYLLEAAGEYGVPVLILDRPNPLGGKIAGPPLDAAQSSLVGRYNVPVQHGLTLGELAQLVNGLWNTTPAALTVIPCAGWSRGFTWDRTGRAFVPPSPNMPHLSTALQYPGACLIEGTTLSEGRGTALPFEIVGAPMIDPLALAERLNQHTHLGARFRPHTFRPSASKFAGEYCHGVQVHLTNPAASDALTIWLTVLLELRALYPDGWQWLDHHFDRLVGNDQTRAQIDVGASIANIMAGWADFNAEFARQRADYLLLLKSDRP